MSKAHHTIYIALVGVYLKQNAVALLRSIMAPHLCAHRQFFFFPTIILLCQLCFELQLL